MPNAHWQPFFDNLQKHVVVDALLRSQLEDLIEEVAIKKRQFIDQPGFTSGYRNYVLTGAFRSFFITPDGKDHTVQIAIEDHFVSDFYSYITQTPATLHVEALENSTLLRLPYQKIEALCRSSHTLSEYFRITTERAFAFSRKRALISISQSAEEKYEDFVRQYPQMANRIPLKVIASYLGFSPEFLSKIRTKKA